MGRHITICLGLIVNFVFIIVPSASIVPEPKIVVSTVLSTPYVMVKNNWNETGPREFEGFAIDLIHEISNILNIDYTIKLSSDGRYGSKNPETKEWNGLIGDLLDGRSDIAISDMTITPERQEVIDFSTPFMRAGIAILYKRMHINYPNLFAFLSPFSTTIWQLIAIFYVGVSIVLYLIARFSPYENTSSENSENQLTFGNSFWFTISSFMLQGNQIVPRALSTRFLSAFWWIVSLIIVCTYTANLSANLTVQKLTKTSSELTFDDLVKSDVRFGAIANGATAAFFRGSQYPVYQRIWNKMSDSPDLLVPNTSQGIDNVIEHNGKYAFFMESTTLEYIIERNCDLVQVGKHLNEKYFGIAMPQNSPYRTRINQAILMLQEQGFLEFLRAKWWEHKYNDIPCTQDVSTRSYELDAEYIGGALVVLLLGAGIACLIAAIEFMFKCIKNNTGLSKM